MIVTLTRSLRYGGTRARARHAAAVSGQVLCMYMCVLVCFLVLGTVRG